MPAKDKGLPENEIKFFRSSSVAVIQKVEQALKYLLHWNRLLAEPDESHRFAMALFGKNEAVTVAFDARADTAYYSGFKHRQCQAVGRNHRAPLGEPHCPAPKWHGILSVEQVPEPGRKPHCRFACAFRGRARFL